MKKSWIKIWLLFFLTLATVFLWARTGFSQVFDGQQINATVTNNAFWKRNVNDTAVGIYTLSNVVAASGSSVTNMQREFNACSSYTGMPLNSVYNILPAWTHNDVGSSSDTLKGRTDLLTQRFNGTTGHAHTGATGDGPQLTDSAIATGAAIARSKIATGTPGYMVYNDGTTGALNQEAQCTIAQGCTGQTTASAAFDALAPTTTKGDIIVRNSSTNIRLAVCPDGQNFQADSTQTSGWKCVTPASTSGFAHSGANSDITSMSGLTGAIADPTYVEFTQISTPSTPSSGFDRMYIKSDDNLYIKNSAGTETQVGGSGTVTFPTYFEMSGGVTVGNMGPPDEAEKARTVSKITCTMRNSGASGSTVVTIYYGPALASSTTISITANSDLNYAEVATPGIAQSIHDYIDMAVTSVAAGAPDDLRCKIFY